MQREAHQESRPSSSFGAMLRAARKKKGLSQVKVESKLPLGPKNDRRMQLRNSSEYVSSWELGNSFPKGKVLPALAQILGLPLEDLALKLVIARITKTTQEALEEMEPFLPQRFVTKK